MKAPAIQNVFMHPAPIQQLFFSFRAGTNVTNKIVWVRLFLGSEASFIVAVTQLERYPVDLYYLVDVSASMQENLDHVNVTFSY